MNLAAGFNRRLGRNVRGRLGLAALGLLILLTAGLGQFWPDPPRAIVMTDERLLAEAFAARRSGIQVVGAGTVARVLPDDTRGSKHQRFIIRLGSGQSVLVAHNIDLAPRIHSLKEGDEVEFNGEYEWNEKGGVLHWTHHDPAGRHEDGWLRHEGMLYQ